MIKDAKWAARALAAVLCAATVIAAGSAGFAQPGHQEVVSANPVDWTPHVLDGTVYSLAQAGTILVVAGEFSRVADASGQQVTQRHNIFGFDTGTNTLAGLNIDIDGPVLAVQEGPDGTAFLGGSFRNVNGRPSRGLVQIRVADGSVVDTFSAQIDYGEVRVLRRLQNWLYVGGSFTAVSGLYRPGLARLHTDGAVDAGFDAGLDAPREERIKVNDLAITSDGRRLVIVGGFAWAQGLLRRQVAVLDADAQGVAVSPWRTDAYRPECDRQFSTYVRAVAISPDDRFFVVVTTGHKSAPHLLCNTAARFDLDGGGRQEPVWVNHTGGNTLHAVAVTTNAVYVGGHQQWLDNPRGDKSAGPGAVPRQGIGAISPDSGRALPWNPGRSRGVGVRVFLPTGAGLWVGSDTETLGGEYHARLGLFPQLSRTLPPPGRRS